MKNLQEEYAHPENESNLPKEWKYAHGHPKDLIIGDAAEGIKLVPLLKIFVIT
mgnify:CR=1 FL=1